MKLVHGAALAAALLMCGAVAACSGDGHPPASNEFTPDGGGGGPGDDDDDDDGGADGSSDPDATSDAGYDSGEEIGPPVDLIDGSVKDDEPCSAEMVFGASADVPGLDAIGTVDSFAIANDELSIVWHVAGATTLGRAARAAVTQPFGGIANDPIPSGMVASGPMTLSPSGLRLIVTLTNDGAGELTRASTGAGFGATPSTEPFDVLAAFHAPTSEHASDFAFGSETKALYFRSGQGESHIINSGRVDDAWQVGTPLVSPHLITTPPATRRPTWMSPDERCLVVVESATNTSRFVKRPNTAAPFTTTLELGARTHVSLGTQCARMYSLVSGKVTLTSR